MVGSCMFFLGMRQFSQLAGGNVRDGYQQRWVAHFHRKPFLGASPFVMVKTWEGRVPPSLPQTLFPFTLTVRHDPSSRRVRRSFVAHGGGGLWPGKRASHVRPSQR